MNGYLMQEQDWVAGQDLFIESFSPENHFGVVFEDDGEAAYFYAIEKDGQGEGMRILDALHIYESADREEGEASAERADRDDRADQKGRLDQQEQLEQEEPATRQKPANRENRANLEEPANQEKRLGKKEAGHLPPGPGKHPAAKPADLKIIWTRDWKKCALVIDGYVHALFDFEMQGGYNINEFPPPNSIWTNGDRTLTDELIRELF